MQLPNPEQILVLDIETVSQHPEFAALPAEWKKLWEEKIAWQLEEGISAEQFYHQRAAILAEFGKIVCVSAGYFRSGSNGMQFRLKSFFGKDEKTVLGDFMDSMQKLINAKKVRIWLAGHNIREFDVPYLCRRLLINNMALPAWLDFQALKPWDVPVIDTMQLWKFGDYKNYTSLSLLAACLGIASPKDDMDGSMVGQVYWKENDLERIAIYCQKDVVTVAQLLLRFSQKPMLEPEQIVTMAQE
jgi:3'-5' exonuclease